ncbi:PGF-CTERM sorting domain-containing protein [Halosimplex aquaticum]
MGRWDQDEAPPVRWHATVGTDDVNESVGIRAEDGRLAVGGGSWDDYDEVDPWSVTVDATDGSNPSHATLDVEGQFLTQGSVPVAGGGRLYLGNRTLEPDIEDATSEPMLVASGEDGETAWQRTYEPPFEMFSAAALAPGPSGGAVFVGYSVDIDNPNTWVAAVDAEGNVRWEQQLDEFFATFATGIEPTGDGGYLVYGSTMRGEQWDIDRQDGWAARISAEGDPQWSQRYRQRSAGGQSEYHRFVDAVETGSGYLLVGDLAPSADDAATRGWAVTVDSEGERLYTALDRPGTDGGGKFVAAVPYGDEFALVGSAYRSDDRVVETPWILGVDATLSTNWDVLDPLDQSAVVRDAVAAAGGGIALAGNHDTEDGWSEPFVAKLGGDPAETPTPSSTPTPTPSPSPTPTAAPSPTPTDAATRSSTPAQTRTADDAAEAEDAPATSSGDGPGFGVGATLAALGSVGALLRRSQAPTDEE